MVIKQNHLEGMSYLGCGSVLTEWKEVCVWERVIVWPSMNYLHSIFSGWMKPRQAKCFQSSVFGHLSCWTVELPSPPFSLFCFTGTPAPAQFPCLHCCLMNPAGIWMCKEVWVSVYFTTSWDKAKRLFYHLILSMHLDQHAPTWKLHCS